MVAWHRSRRADIGLRGTGLLLCWLSYAAFARLVGQHAPGQPSGLLASGLAAAGFLAASGGTAMTILGFHLFDEVEVSARWRQRPVSSPIPSLERNAAMDIPEPAMLVVGRDLDGDWSVRESAGMLLGRFSSAQAARRFAGAERRGRSAVSVASSAGIPRRIEGRLTLVADRPARGGTVHG